MREDITLYKFCLLEVFYWNDKEKSLRYLSRYLMQSVVTLPG